ncbi:MAG: NUDIX hydrolase [Rubrobacter sp.]
MGRDYLYRSPWFDFRLDAVELPDGERIEYGVFEGREVAVVLALTSRGKVVMVKQWRQPLRDFSLSLPGGMVDCGEKPEVAASRELFEETGYEAGEMELLFKVHPSPGRTDEVCYIFRCEAVIGVSSRPDATEFIEVVEVGVDEMKRKVSEGEITDAATVLALTRIS